MERKTCIPMTITGYSKQENVKLTRQAVYSQIKENRLPSGVTAQKVTNSNNWIIWVLKDFNSGIIS